MKNINYVINGVLAVAVVILYIMQFSGKKESSVTRTFASAGDTTALLPIAYVMWIPCYLITIIPRI